MIRQINAAIAEALLLSAMPSTIEAQQGVPRPSEAVREEEPPGRDLYIPYMASPGLPQERELQNVEQVRILAEMNKLTVELVKRRSNRTKIASDTPKLVKRVKELAKKLRDLD